MLRRFLYILSFVVLTSCSVFNLNRKRPVVTSRPIPFSSLNRISYSADSLKNVRTIESMKPDFVENLDNQTSSITIPYIEIPLGVKVVEQAKDYLGCKYKGGGSGPDRFDCSGFTSFIYRKFGVELHRSSGDQWLDGEEIKDRKTLIPGDLVYFNGYAVGSRIGHVGIVTDPDPKTGEFYFIHAAVHGGIRIDHSTDYYYKVRYKGARRIFN